MVHQLVIVRDYKGRGHVKAVWGKAEGKVYVTSETVLKDIIAGKSKLMPIGFPERDVFEYEPEAARVLPEADWSQLKQWKGQ
jgi:hypothetical protein